MNRKKLVLFILLIILLLAIVWSFMSVPRQKTVATLKYQQGQAAPVARKTTVPDKVSDSAARTVKGDSRTLQLALLESEQSGFKGYRRNIFKPLFIDPAMLMKQKAIAVKPVIIPPVAVAPPVAPPVTPQETLRRTLANFVFLGYLKKDNRKTIFLSKDKDIILVRKGDRFAGSYEARSITDQALTIVATDSDQEIIIPLIENQPLIAAGK